MRPVLAKQCVKSHREVYALYAVDSDVSASCFRRRLDRQLRERFRPAVAWEIASLEEEDAG